MQPVDLFRNFLGKDFIEDFFDTNLVDKLNAGVMRADIKDKENEYLVEVEIPGVRKEDISLELTDDRLTVSAKSEAASEEKFETYVCRERRFGEFSRTFLLQGIDNDNVNAEYKEGILKITLPKAKESKRGRKIELN